MQVPGFLFCSNLKKFLLQNFRKQYIMSDRFNSCIVRSIRGIVFSVDASDIFKVRKGIYSGEDRNWNKSRQTDCGGVHDSEKKRLHGMDMPLYLRQENIAGYAHPAKGNCTGLRLQHGRKPWTEGYYRDAFRKADGTVPYRGKG